MGLVLVFCAACSFGLTRHARRYALRRELVDHASARASHMVPTPRGGGVAIVVTALIGVLALYGLGFGMTATVVALTGGGAAVAAIGWIDDHGHVPAAIRLVVHFAAAGWGVFWLGPIITPYGVANYPVGLIATVATMVFVVWCINLFNFMDGIDGIASSEAIIVSVGAAAAFMLVTGSVTVGIPALVVAAATSGFLLWNWPPACIFMGDVSSGFLGFVVGMLVLAGNAIDWRIGCSVLILFGAFFVDASVTLAGRVLRGRRIHEPHRNHAYQILALRWGTHRPVTIVYIAISLLWLTPWAAAVTANLVNPLVSLVAAFLPLATMAWMVGAGRA